jgi:hypothetical protein
MAPPWNESRARSAQSFPATTVMSQALLPQMRGSRRRLSRHHVRLAPLGRRPGHSRSSCALGRHAAALMARPAPHAKSRPGLPRWPSCCGTSAIQSRRGPPASQALAKAKAGADIDPPSARRSRVAAGVIIVARKPAGAGMKLRKIPSAIITLAVLPDRQSNRSLNFVEIPSAVFGGSRG